MKAFFARCPTKNFESTMQQKARERSKIMAYEVIVEQFLNIFA